jgi:hypothetical protein
MLTNFEGTFERNNIQRNGICVLEFKVSAVDLHKVVGVLSRIDSQLKVTVSVIEDVTMHFDIKECSFKQLDIYREGNSKIKFETEPANVVGFENIKNLIDKNLDIEIDTIGEEDE